MGGVIFIFLLILFFAWALSGDSKGTSSRHYRKEPLTMEEIRYVRSQCWNKPVAERRRMMRNYKR